MMGEVLFVLTVFPFFLIFNFYYMFYHMEPLHERVLSFITAVRKSQTMMEDIFTQGSCYNFYLILKEVFPRAIGYYNHDHVITKIGDKYYDITGEIKANFIRNKYLPLYHYDDIHIDKLLEAELLLGRKVFWTDNKTKRHKAEYAFSINEQGLFVGFLKSHPAEVRTSEDLLTLNLKLDALLDT